MTEGDKVVTHSISNEAAKGRLATADVVSEGGEVAEGRGKDSEDDLVEAVFAGISLDDLLVLVDHREALGVRWKAAVGDELEGWEDVHMAVGESLFFVRLEHFELEINDAQMVRVLACLEDPRRLFGEEHGRMVVASKDDIDAADPPSDLLVVLEGEVVDGKHDVCVQVVPQHLDEPP